jgi:hypothetical protein
MLISIITIHAKTYTHTEQVDKYLILYGFIVKLSINNRCYAEATFRNFREMSQLHYNLPTEEVSGSPEISLDALSQLFTWRLH